MRYHGNVGFVDYEEIRPGVWDYVVTEHECSGVVLSKSNRFVSSIVNGVNDDLVISTRISIIADPFINQHFPSIKYVEYKGVKWLIKEIDDSKYPRLIISLGEVYTDGQQT